MLNFFDNQLVRTFYWFMQTVHTHTHAHTHLTFTNTHSAVGKIKLDSQAANIEVGMLMRVLYGDTLRKRNGERTPHVVRFSLWFLYTAPQNHQ